jgi:hypothetical protein
VAAKGGGFKPQIKMDADDPEGGIPAKIGCHRPARGFMYILYVMVWV